MVEQTLEPRTTKTPAFTALATSGVTVWGYKSASLPIPDAISNVIDPQTADDQWYDLRGFPVATPLKKGIYIKNGRKYFFQK
jgi:hypothetical protein